MGLLKFLKIRKRDRDEFDDEERGRSPSPDSSSKQTMAKRPAFRRQDTVLEITPLGFHIVLNAPFTLGFCALCFVIRILSMVSDGFGHWFASPYLYTWRQIFSFEFYWRLVSHAVGHGSWGHMTGNLTLYLLVTPMLEEKYSAMLLIKMSIATSVFTALVNCLFTNTVVLGASGLVFQNMILSSFTNVKKGQIPITLLMTMLFHMSGEIKAFFWHDPGSQVSNLAHILGGIFGAILGYKFASGHNYQLSAAERG